ARDAERDLQHLGHREASARVLRERDARRLLDDQDLALAVGADLDAAHHAVVPDALQQLELALRAARGAGVLPRAVQLEHDAQAVRTARSRVHRAVRGVVNAVPDPVAVHAQHAALRIGYRRPARPG